MHISGMGPPTSGCYLAPLVTAGGHYDRADPVQALSQIAWYIPTDIPLSYRATDGGPPARLGYREGVTRERKPRPGPVRKTLPSTP